MVSMSILLLSDIHANLVALETVLAHTGTFDQIWCLGDVVGYGPAPNECIEKLRTLPTICLAGNHDWAVLSKLDVNEFNEDAYRAILWTQDVLTPRNYTWLEQRLDKLALVEHNLTLVHGSPRLPIWEYILSTSSAVENMSAFDTGLCFYGHTHVPMLYHQPPGEKNITRAHLAEGKPLTLTAKTLLNPGSVGQPRDRDSRAAYARFDPASATITYHRVEYDIAKTQAAMVKAKLPPRLIARLNYGL